MFSSRAYCVGGPITYRLSWQYLV